MSKRGWYQSAVNKRKSHFWAASVMNSKYFTPLCCEDYHVHEMLIPKEAGKCKRCMAHLENNTSFLSHNHP